MKKYVLFLWMLLCIPCFAHATVSINEIAWMGIVGENGQYGEWIELYNDSDQVIDLSGWKVYKDSNKLLFTLTKTIQPHEFLVVKRKTTSTPDPLPSIPGELLSFGSSGLSNTGEDVVVKDKSGKEVQKLSFAKKWPAGDAEKKHSMQWNGSSWVTASPTPNEKNVEGAQKPDEDTDAPTQNEDKEEDVEVIEKKEEEDIPFVSTNKPTINFVFPEQVYRGVPYVFESIPILDFNFRVNRGTYEWNMGDGTVYTFTEPHTVTHTYAYPGVYTVSFIYKSPENMSFPTLKGIKKVAVLNPSIDSSIVNTEAIEFKNKSNALVDLSGYRLRTSTQEITLPEMTLLSAGATVTMLFKTLGLEKTEMIELKNPLGQLIAKTK